MYSVIIRTLIGGPKYLALLQSIAQQTVRPEHIYIVQPYGYNAPEESIGFEEYIHCAKGMWMQRIYGMEYCYNQPSHSKYLLVCDDDVTFEADFVEQLIMNSEKHKADFMIPLGDLKLSFPKRILYALIGGPFITGKSTHRNCVLLNGSWSCNNSLKENVNPTQSGNFQCFLMRTDATAPLSLKEELWIDETRYAWPDDMMFFYKANLCGLNVLSCKMPTFIHNDGKAGVTARQRIEDAAYSIGRNGYIFWKRFIYKYQNGRYKKLKALAWWNYRVLAIRILYIMLGLKRKSLFQLKAYNRGLEDGRLHQVLKYSTRFHKN